MTVAESPIPWELSAVKKTEGVGCRARGRAGRGRAGRGRAGDALGRWTRAEPRANQIGKKRERGRVGERREGRTDEDREGGPPK